MKYRLKRDLPGYKAGEILDTEHGLPIRKDSYMFAMIEHAGRYSEWFEPIKESTRCRAEHNGVYWYIDEDSITADSSEDNGFSTYHDNRFNAGNYFKTRQEAQAVAEAFKAVLEYVHNVDDVADVSALNRAAYKAREAVHNDL